MSLSHEDMLLLILSDNRWHSTAEILRRSPMMVHSRAAGLRDKGFTVEHRTVGKGAKGSEYRLHVLGGGTAKRTGSPTTGLSPVGDPEHGASDLHDVAVSPPNTPLGEGDPSHASDGSPDGGSVRAPNSGEPGASPSPSGAPYAAHSGLPGHRRGAATRRGEPDEGSRAGHTPQLLLFGSVRAW